MLCDDRARPGFGSRLTGWRNLYLVAGYGSVLSAVVVPSEDAARCRSAAFFAEWDAYVAETGDDLVDLEDGNTVRLAQIVRPAIPIPGIP